MVGSTFEFLESGVQLVWKDGQVFLLLDAHPEDGPELPDLSRNIGYAAGRECFLEVEPLRPDGSLAS